MQKTGRVFPGIAADTQDAELEVTRLRTMEISCQDTKERGINCQLALGRSLADAIHSRGNRGTIIT